LLAFLQESWTGLDNVGKTSPVRSMRAVVNAPMFLQLRFLGSLLLPTTSNLAGQLAPLATLLNHGFGERMSTDVLHRQDDHLQGTSRTETRGRPIDIADYWMNEELLTSSLKVVAAVRPLCSDSPRISFQVPRARIRK
jgi:hypothetical protein